MTILAIFMIYYIKKFKNLNSIEIFIHLWEYFHSYSQILLKIVIICSKVLGLGEFKLHKHQQYDFQVIFFSLLLSIFSLFFK